MTSKVNSEETPLVSRCLAVILKEKKSRKSSADGRRALKGKELFEEFVKENKTCYWNPHLEESMKSLKYVGCIHNSSILVGGRDIYLDTIRAAWGRRVLRAPGHYSLQSVGEIPSIDMLVLNQTQFTPLPEALCIIISDLNQVRSLASFDTIMEKLGETYKGLHQPSEQIVYETLDSLLNERKLYHTGKGYAIVTPETYQLGHMNLSLNDRHLVLGSDSHVLNEDGVPTLYIPLLPPTNSNDMCSIACQTEAKQDPDTTTSSPEKDESTDKSKKFERSKSFREPRKGKDKKDNSLTRSGSVRYEAEKAMAVVKDVNLRTSDVNQDKDKGEKSSLLSKIFGRNKSKKAAAVAIEEVEADKSEVEYATFSAQFPPPDWGWYETQVQKALHQQRQTVVAKSKTWHHLQSPPHYVDAEVQSDILDDDNDSDLFNYHLPSCPVRRSKTLPEGLRSGGLPNGGPLHATTPGSRSSSSHSLDRTSPHPATSTPQSPRKQGPPYHSSDTEHGAKLHRSLQEDVRPKTNANPSCHDSSADTGKKHINGDQNSEDADLNNSSALQDKPSHVSRVFKRYKEMKCSSFVSNDISIEQCGKVRRKGSSIGASRDSGVNCVGLGTDLTIKGKDKVVENNNNKKGSHDTPLNNQTVEHTNSVRVKHKKTPNVCDNLHHQTFSGISPFTTHAQVHSVPEQSQEDSGFNSPRTLDLSESMSHCIPRPVYCPVPIEEQDEVCKPVHSNPQTPGSCKYESPSTESIPMTGSEFYPTYASGLVPNKLQESREMAFTGSNMWSDSSKQTVREVNGAAAGPPSPRRGSSGHRKSRHSRRDPSSQQQRQGKSENHLDSDIITKTGHHQNKLEGDFKNQKGKGSGKSSSSTKHLSNGCRGVLDLHSPNINGTSDLGSYNQHGTFQS